MDREQRTRLQNTLATVLGRVGDVRSMTDLALSGRPQHGQLMGSFNWALPAAPLARALIMTLEDHGGRGSGNYLAATLTTIADSTPLTRNQRLIIDEAVRDLTSGNAQLPEPEPEPAVAVPRKVTGPEYIEVLREAVYVGERAKAALSALGETW